MLLLLLLLLLLCAGLITVSVSLYLESPCLVLSWNLFLVRLDELSSFHSTCVHCLRLLTAAFDYTVMSLSRSALGSLQWRPVDLSSFHVFRCRQACRQAMCFSECHLLVESLPIFFYLLLLLCSYFHLRMSFTRGISTLFLWGRCCCNTAL